jgi:hypothetical protein
VDYGLLILILFLLAPLLERLLGLGRPKQGPPGEGEQPGAEQRGQRLPDQRRVPADDQEERPFRSIPSADAQEEQSAATMLPDDLWEVLTGEKRAPAPRRDLPTEAVPAEPAAPRRETATTAAPSQSAPSRAADRARREAESRERDRLRNRERYPGSARTRERAPAPSRERSLERVSMRSPQQDKLAEPRQRAAPPRSAADDLVRREHVHEQPVVVPFGTPPMDADERQAKFYERRSRMSAAAEVERVARSSEYTFTGPADIRRSFVMAQILGKPKAFEE